MPRKGDNIYKRKDGRYEGRYIKGRKSNGKLDYGFVYGYNYKEIKERLTELKSEYKYHNWSGQKRGDCRNSAFSDWLYFWSEKIIKSEVNPSTYSSYSGTIQRHILPLLGEKKLNRLCGNDIQQFINSLVLKNLSPSYIHGIFRVLNFSLEKAMEMNFIYFNPCKNISLPDITKPKIKILTANEQKALEKAAENDDIGPAVMLSLHTGMRPGEICALTWDDINFKKNIINVQHTVQRISSVDKNSVKKTEILFGKSRRSLYNRVILMSPDIASYMYSLKIGSNSKYVIHCKNGFMEPRNLGYRFQHLLKKAGLAPVNFSILCQTHDIRRMESGFDITVLDKLLEPLLLANNVGNPS